MLKEEDDQEDAASIAIARYPCMPSLVALQQMKNRLHLAFVGKKLMKWTAQATGRELRKLALDLIQSCQYGQACRDAFILLARARYFYPNLNKMVLEHLGHAANVTVDVKTKSISGVKVLHLDLIDTGQDTYQHLGIEKGGQAILEAKQAWKALLFRSIHCLEQREAFLLVDMAHRSATKKKNVLGKIVIPRTTSSISYILETLEERAREDFYRLKKILQVKKRLTKCNHEELVTTCPECIRKKAKQDDRERCVICGDFIGEEDFEEMTKTEDEVEENEMKLEAFKSQIGEIVEITKDIDKEGIVTVSIQEFLKTAEQLKEKLEGQVVKVLDPIPSDTALEKMCNICIKRFKDEQAAKNIEEGKETSLHSILTVKSERQIDAPKLCEYHAHMDADLELGTFETEVQEITKVIRIKNEDGSISEEKKVIRIKKEVRAPSKHVPCTLPVNDNEGSRHTNQSSDATDKSKSFADPKTVGVVLVNDSNIKTVREAKSEIIDFSPQMANPIVRSCMSLMSFTSLESSNITFSFLSSTGTLSIDKIRELAASSTNFEEILRLFEVQPQNIREVSIENVELSKNNTLTESERNLIERITDDTSNSVPRSKSNNNAAEKVAEKINKTASSNDKKKNYHENQSNEK